MSDAKYGRLFTQADLEAAIGVAAGIGKEQRRYPACDEVLHQMELERWSLAFPADEPLFLLRGQDKAVPDTISTYWDICMGFGDPIEEDECPAEHCDAIQAAGEALDKWQRENPERVKVPGT
jgi:hypothetical protein